tara:strand:- start:593 stop:1594 length:1002 start_codon:yes stop_codon:yes gene_type:complete
MSNTRSFTDFDSPDSGTTLSTTEAGVLLTDTLEDFREKTNGIIEKVKATDTAATAIKAGGLDNNSVALTKIAQVGDNKLLGNVSGGTANVSEIEIDVTASGLQDSDDTIPSSKAVRDYIDDRVGSIVQQQYLRINTVGTYSSELIGTSGDRKTTVASGTGAALINMQGLNFSRDGPIDGSGTANNDMYAGEILPLRASITPVYADSVIVIEIVLSCEPYRGYDAGLWMGELNASNELQIINRTGYEGYNPTIATGRNNFYSSGFYDANATSTMKSIPLTYIDKPNTTNAKTYSVMFGSAHHNAVFVTNRTLTESENYQYEYGVSTISIKEIRQ